MLCHCHLLNYHRLPFFNQFNISRIHFFSCVLHFVCVECTEHNFTCQKQTIEIKKNKKCCFVNISYFINYIIHYSSSMSLNLLLSYYHFLLLLALYFHLFLFLNQQFISLTAIQSQFLLRLLEIEEP